MSSQGNHGPAPMAPTERALLLAVMRWARAEGIEFESAYWWTRRGPIEQHWGVSLLDGESPFLTVWRGRDTGRDYWVRSLAEAIDLLVTLGILPARFSTAYRAGWDAVHSIIGVPNEHIADLEYELRPVAK